MNLKNYGWNESWQASFEQVCGGAESLIPARIITAYSQHYQVVTQAGTVSALIRGKIAYNSLYSAKLPVIGDWVAVSENPFGPYSIEAVLPRRTKLERQQADDIGAQVLAANVDAAIVIQSVKGDFSPRRLDRYLTMIWNSGVVPIVVLSKADLVSDENEIQSKKLVVQRSYPGVDVVVVSSITRRGIEQIRALLKPSRTYAAMGSSGVGKSTLLNVLAEEEIMETSEVRAEDQRGRHTTTHRQLIRLPHGALYIDAPGLREMALFAFDAIDTTFSDIREYAALCKFSDCTHRHEPGCAVKQAIIEGKLDQQRLDSYHKLLREMGHEKAKKILLNKRLSNARKKRSKIHYKNFTRGVADHPRERFE